MRSDNPSWMYPSVDQKRCWAMTGGAAGGGRRCVWKEDHNGQHCTENDTYWSELPKERTEVSTYEEKMAERHRLMTELAAAKKAQSEADANLARVRRENKARLMALKLESGTQEDVAIMARDAARTKAQEVGAAFAALMMEMEGMKPVSAAAAKKRRKADDDAQSLQRHADKVEFGHLLPDDFFSMEEPSPLTDQDRLDLREFGRLVADGEDREVIRAEISAAIGRPQIGRP